MASWLQSPYDPHQPPWPWSRALTKGNSTPSSYWEVQTLFVTLTNQRVQLASSVPAEGLAWGLAQRVGADVVIVQDSPQVQNLEKKQSLQVWALNSSQGGAGTQLWCSLPEASLSHVSLASLSPRLQSTHNETSRRELLNRADRGFVSSQTVSGSVPECRLMLSCYHLCAFPQKLLFPLISQFPSPFSSRTCLARYSYDFCPPLTFV